MNGFELSLSTVIKGGEEFPSVRNAGDILRRDMSEVLTGYGKENTINVLIDDNMGKESFTAEAAEDSITIRAGDDLGAVYGLLSISEKFLGIKPLSWWTGTKTERKDKAVIPAGTWSSPEYKVRFRCWFINDEVLFLGWHKEEAERAAVWRRVFETVLRCGGNMVIAGTDREYDGQMLNGMALDMGLWLTQHHTELLGARMFGRAYPDLKPSYILYPELFEGLWKEAIDRYAGRRVVWTIGFRGQGDSSFWESDTSFDSDEKRGKLISDVMRRQMELVREKDKDAVFTTNLYGEMTGLYRNGFLDIPDGVIKIWGDNGYGKMVSRRQNNDNPRNPSMPDRNDNGKNGIYYHISFYDLQAANHITMLQNPPQMIADELKAVLDNGGGEIWNVNVGSVKPHVFMLDLIRRMWTTGQYDEDEAASEFASDYYGESGISPVYTEYSEHAVHYGPNEDDRAGDQYYHFPLRSLARALMSGGTEKPLESLFWAAGDISYKDQLEKICSVAYAGMTSWKEYLRKCHEASYLLTEEAALRFRDDIILQAYIHKNGCESLYSFCNAAAHEMKGDHLQAFLWADRALEAAGKTLEKMNRVHGRFAHIYDNDCFAGVGLTAQVLTSLRSWLRIKGDGDLLYDWEKAFLIPPEENRVMLQTHRSMQLTDDDLALRLKGEIELVRAL
jgi:hypothetical protein